MDDCQYCENCNKILQPGDLMLTLANIINIEVRENHHDEMYFCSLSCGEEWLDKSEDEW